MISPKHLNLPHLHGYPGDGYYYVMCAICGGKYRAKDTILINDKYNMLNGMVVCKRDYEETNPLNAIESFRERGIQNPDMIQPEGADRFVFISDPAEITTGDLSDPTSRAPGASRFLTFLTSSATIVEMVWIGPLDTGSDTITGFKIERESPVGGGFSTIITSTLAPACYYKDTTTSASTTYNYRITAINRAGISDATLTGSITTEAT